MENSVFRNFFHTIIAIVFLTLLPAFVCVKAEGDLVAVYANATLVGDFDVCNYVNIPAEILPYDWEGNRIKDLEDVEDGGKVEIYIRYGQKHCRSHELEGTTHILILAYDNSKAPRVMRFSSPDVWEEAEKKDLKCILQVTDRNGTQSSYRCKLKLGSNILTAPNCDGKIQRWTYRPDPFFAFK